MMKFHCREALTPVLLMKASLEPTTKRREDLGKHNVHTHFSKDRNCEICKRTKITRAPCRVDLPEVYFDRKDEAPLRDVVIDEVLVPAKGAPQTGWRVDRFPQGPGRMRLVSTSLWSSRPPT